MLNTPVPSSSGVLVKSERESLRAALKQDAADAESAGVSISARIAGSKTPTPGPIRQFTLIIDDSEPPPPIRVLPIVRPPESSWSLSRGLTPRHLGVAAVTCLVSEAVFVLVLPHSGILAFLPAGALLCFLTMLALAVRLWRSNRKAAVQLLLYGFLLVNLTVILRVVLSFFTRSPA